MPNIMLLFYIDSIYQTYFIVAFMLIRKTWDGQYVGKGDRRF